MDNEPRPILGMSIVFGSPFVIVGINQFLNPEINNSWPFSFFKALALKMLPYIFKLVLVLLIGLVVFKGVTTVLKKIKSWVETERNKIRNSLLYRQEDFERRLSSHIKDDRKKREEDFANFEKKIIQLLEEFKSPAMHISTETSENTVFKNFA